MLTVEKQHSLSLLEQKLNFMCPVCIITVRQVPFHLKVTESRSEVLGGPPYIPTREIPQGLAKGRVHDI